MDNGSISGNSATDGNSSDIQEPNGQSSVDIWISELNDSLSELSSTGDEDESQTNSDSQSSQQSSSVSTLSSRTGSNQSEETHPSFGSDGCVIFVDSEGSRGEYTTPTSPRSDNLVQYSRLPNKLLNVILFLGLTIPAGLIASFFVGENRKLNKPLLRTSASSGSFPPSESPSSSPTTRTTESSEGSRYTPGGYRRNLLAEAFQVTVPNNDGNLVKDTIPDEFAGQVDPLNVQVSRSNLRLN